MLLLDFIHDYVLTPCLSKFVVNKSSGYRCKQEEVKENEYDKEDIIGLIILYCKYLIVRVEIIGS